MKIIGRKTEIATMSSYLQDDKAHMLALTGRRRVGKTFLIRAVYKTHMMFEMTGLKNAGLGKQLMNFTLQLNTYFPDNGLLTRPESWLIAFNELSKALTASQNNQKQVVFFDELPWIASKRSGFTEALAHWWNNWASQQNIIVVVCGSAASWMLEHVVNAKGGLHNRITKLITLMPFTLAETKDFLAAKKIQLSDYQIVQLYMAIGGIPHYLEQVVRGRSTAQNIQEMCFSKDGILRTEFENLYQALFDNAGNHIKIIKTLAGKARGLDRTEILALTGVSDGGTFSKLLSELEASGFISTFSPLENKRKETLYRLTDEYSLFYLQFMEGQQKGRDWLRISQEQTYKIWCGYAFENLCMKHIGQLKKALGISGVETRYNSFIHKKNETYEKGFQIDLLIDRKDDTISICEMKFHADEFAINQAYAKTLQTRKEGLKKVTKTKKMVEIAFITTYGVLENDYKQDWADHDLKIDILFEP